MTLLAVAPYGSAAAWARGLLAWLEAPGCTLDSAHSTVSCPLERSGYFSRRGFNPRFSEAAGTDPTLFLRPLTRRAFATLNALTTPDPAPFLACIDAVAAQADRETPNEAARSPSPGLAAAMAEAGPIACSYPRPMAAWRSPRR